MPETPTAVTSDERFDGLVVLISGGARGQGAAEARALVARGASVVIGDVLADAGRALADELGARAAFVHLDVGEAADWSCAVARAEELGPLHGLVNGAGIFLPKPLLDTDLALFERHIRVNQTGCFLGMQAVVPAMRRAGGGSIVNVASVAGLRGAPGAIAYSATKWALRGMTRSAALELAADGIRVNGIFPGPIDTEMLSFRTADQTQRRTAAVPMKRMGKSEEVAELVLFLLSDRSSYMTGAEISIDGGLAA